MTTPAPTGPQTPPPVQPDNKPAYAVYIRATDLTTGQPKVNIHIPLHVVKAGINILGRFMPHHENFNYSAVTQAIENGTKGKIMDIDDMKQHEHIEISIE